ncbi:MAG: 2-oxoacid:ferredoxin oxidoreductase subunit beta [SAR324 cluster bacterium]|nr:2-oxoacid:ferredoxin oxidoreductase subunit beta [SAR324 cluster bacterium]MCZ6626933.1 2-oxoacid:ferredoxin oxidoreductase subunit beta [SAR324 cluster bacterium]
MTEAARQSQPEVNRLNLSKKEYVGSDSTMCKGCGHDAITASIIQACYDVSIDPMRVVKFSGIGCSSKTTNYFMNQAFGINGIHGRMSAIATGSGLANHTLLPIGVSGDGDTASIGLGNFIHMMRRNLRITYIVENNGVYGLTKGQFSATADLGTKAKKGWENPWEAIDLASLGVLMGATFVARSFSGDRKQLAPLIEAAMMHNGTAMLDVLSPCVTFNDHEGSTKSLKYIREHRDALNEVGFIPEFQPIEADYDEGSDYSVRMHDGGVVTLHKLKDHDPTDRMQVMTLLEQARNEGKFLTGLIYIDEDKPSFAEQENLGEEPLSMLSDDKLRPSHAALDEINASLMR